MLAGICPTCVAVGPGSGAKVPHETLGLHVPIVPEQAAAKHPDANAPADETCSACPLWPLEDQVGMAGHENIQSIIDSVARLLQSIGTYIGTIPPWSQNVFDGGSTSQLVEVAMMNHGVPSLHCSLSHR